MAKRTSESEQPSTPEKRTTIHPPAPLKYGLGWKRDVAPHTELSVMHLLGAATVRVHEASLAPFVVKVYDQSTTSGCVGQAIAQACDVRFAAMGLKIPARSRLAPYAFARELDTSADAPLQDSGCYPRKAFEALRDWGFPSEVEYPFDIKKVNDRLPVDAVQASADFKVKNWYAIASSYDQRCVQIAQTLISKYPVFCGMTLKRSFEEYKEGIFTAEDMKGDVLGGHAMLIVGFETLSNGELVFLLVNSWGTGWGEQGFIRMHQSVFFDQDINVGDLRAVQVGAA